MFGLVGPVGTVEFVSLDSSRWTEAIAFVETISMLRGEAAEEVKDGVREALL